MVITSVSESIALKKVMYKKVVMICHESKLRIEKIIEKEHQILFCVGASYPGLKMCVNLFFLPNVIKWQGYVLKPKDKDKSSWIKNIRLYSVLEFCNDRCEHIQIACPRKIDHELF